MKKYIILFLLLLFMMGCSVKRFAVRQVGEVIKDGMEAVYSEEDLELAKISIASNLKLLEVLLVDDPENITIKMLLTEGYGAYSLAFIEEASLVRASYFYKKAMKYAEEVLQEADYFKAGFKLSIPAFEKEVSLIKKDHVDSVFWFAFNWGRYILLNLDNTQALFDLPKVEALMKQVMVLDDSFYFSSAHLFFGSLHSARPVMLGGKPDLSKKHFETCITNTQEKFFLHKYYYAKYYAVRVQDQDLFKKMLSDVINGDLEILPSFRLMNKIAQVKAKALLAKSSEYF
ncbi:MAG: TRAP transporter TatT component family protein [Pseudomonadota bacterium]